MTVTVWPGDEVDVPVPIALDVDFSTYTVEVSLGAWETVPGQWFAPHSKTFAADGKSAVAKIRVGAGFLLPTANTYFPWWRVKDLAGNVVGIDHYLSRVVVKDTTGTPIGTQSFVESVVAGTNVTVDSTDPRNPVVSSSGGGGGGVTSFQTRTGAVTLTKADVTGTGLAAADVGADASGAAATAQAAAIAAAATDATTKANAAQAAATSAAATDATSKVAAEATARTSAIATQHTADVAAFDAAGAASTAQAAAISTAATDATTKVAAEATTARAAESANATAITSEATTARAAEALKLAKASNLSDLASAATARTNLGLGGAAVLAVGITTGTVAAGDDSRFTSSSGIRKKGFAIPKGSLDVWDAARAASATTHADVLCSGDSTTEGTPLSGNNTGGWVAKLRALSVAAGITDGGRGQIDGVFDDANLSGESFAGFVSRTGWAASATNNPPGPNSMSSTTVGDVLTLQYKTPSNALRIRCSANIATGRLTVKVNGTTVGTLDPWVAPNQAQTLGTYGETTKVFTGLTAGGTGQTVTITNTGGAPIPNPVQFRTAGTATTGGAIAPGSYTYAATFVDAGGLETALSPTGNQTVPAGTSTNTVTTALDNTVGSASAGNVPPGITKARLYRATGTGITNPASFQRVLEVTSSGNAQIVMIDVGNTPGAAPPSVTQSPFSDPANGGPKTATIAVEFFDSTKGITYHRAGYSGQKYGVLYSSSGTTAATCGYDMQTHLGLVPGLGSAAYAAAPMDWSSPPAGTADARSVKLAICVFGINDMNLSASGTLTADLQSVVEGVSTFILAARSAGADPLVVIPHLTYAGDTTHYPFLGLFKQAILNTADAFGVAWCDFNEALGPPTTAKATSYGYVHLTQTGYDTEATYLWNNVLSASALR